MSFNKINPCHATFNGVPYQTDGVEVRMIPHIRWLIRRDLPDVLQIESDSYDQPWGEKDFLNAMRDRRVVGKVAEYAEQMLGFMVYRLQPHSVYLFDLAVAPARRRMGVGKAMIDSLKRLHLTSGRRRKRIIYELPETNVPAQLFLRSQGFLCIRQERGKFGAEDGYVMQYRHPHDEDLGGEECEGA